MKRAVILMIACMFVWNQATPASESPVIDVHSGHAMPPGGSMLPTRDTARDVLNSSGRHPDWVRIPSPARRDSHMGNLSRSGRQSAGSYHQ